MTGNEDLSGMTVNERLFATGLALAWEEAAINGDREKLVQILAQIELADQAAAILPIVLGRYADQRRRAAFLADN